MHQDISTFGHPQSQLHYHHSESVRGRQERVERNGVLIVISKDVDKGLMSPLHPKYAQDLTKARDLFYLSLTDTSECTDRAQRHDLAGIKSPLDVAFCGRCIKAPKQMV